MAATVRAELDRQFDAARPAATVARPPLGWINAVRRAIGMTERQLAERIGVTQSSVHSLERSEANGTIGLHTLRRAAEALDCELAYVLIPRGSLQRIVEERARDIARSEADRLLQTMALEAQDVETSDALIDERARELIARGGLWRTL